MYTLSTVSRRRLCNLVKSYMEGYYVSVPVGKYLVDQRTTDNFETFDDSDFTHASREVLMDLVTYVLAPSEDTADWVRVNFLMIQFQRFGVKIPDVDWIFKNCSRESLLTAQDNLARYWCNTH